VALFDVDGDDLPELVLGFVHEAPRLYRGHGAWFERDSLDIDTNFDLRLMSAPTLVDFNGDGFVGLLTPRPSAWIWKNRGGTLGLGTSWPAMEGLAPAEILVHDFDGSGNLDQFVMTSDIHDEFDSKRTDYVGWSLKSTAGFTALQGEHAGGKGFDAQPLDWDEDGDLDVYVVNDQGAEFGSNALWASDGAAFVDVTDDCDCGLVHSGMGVDLGDYDRDGRVDLYVTAVTANALLQNQGDGRFVDVAFASGADPLDGKVQEMAWGAIFLDYDNDGYSDLLVAEGDLWYDDMDEDARFEYDRPISLLKQTRTGESITFEDVAEGLGLADRQGSWRATIARDLNADGVLDLLITEIEQTPALYLSTGCTENAWFEVKAPRESRVEICTASGRQVDWTSTHSGWGASQDPIVHFGLGPDETVLGLVIVPPRGQAVVIQDSLSARQRVTYTPDPDPRNP
jgi:hypothetical protein